MPMGGFWTFGEGGFSAYNDETPEAAEARMEQMIRDGYREVTTTYSRCGEIPEQVKHPGNYSEPQDSWLTGWNGGGSDCDPAPTHQRPHGLSLLDRWCHAGKKHK